MKKPNNKVLIISFVVLAIFISVIIYQQINLNSQKQIIKNYENYELDFMRSQKELTSLGEALNNINMSIDYTSCIAYKNKLKQTQESVNNQEKIVIDYFEKFSKAINKEVCFKKLNSFKDKTIILPDLRKKDTDAWEKYCFGWHKAEWTITWNEEYDTPLGNAINSLTEASKKSTEAYNEMIEACFS